MKFVADEGVDKPIVDYLRRLGFNILYIQELSPGIPDNKVLEITKEEKAILLTTDKDFW